eukprot:2018831-Rhodomonas_salina.1
MRLELTDLFVHPLELPHHRPRAPRHLQHLASCSKVKLTDETDWKHGWEVAEGFKGWGMLISC